LIARITFAIACSTTVRRFRVASWSGEGAPNRSASSYLEAHLTGHYKGLIKLAVGLELKKMVAGERFVIYFARHFNGRFGWNCARV
jgi:hypothetical protein